MVAGFVVALEHAFVAAVAVVEEDVMVSEILGVSCVQLLGWAVFAEVPQTPSWGHFQPTTFQQR
jgi:hypothetical protein